MVAALKRPSVPSDRRMNFSPDGVERFLHEQIPLSRAMSVRVRAWQDGELVLAAPLEANHNHLGTAFGGSLAALATLAGYALLWLELGDPAAHIVVRRSEIDYLSPVRGELRAVCRRPGNAELARFRRHFARHGKAGIRLRVTIGSAEEECLVFTGTFVALR